MHCPACRSDLEKFVFNSVEVDQCKGCSGVWLDFREIDELFQNIELPRRLLEGEVKSSGQVIPEGHRTCPHCKCFLTLVEVDDVKLDVCPACHGFFSDLGELESLAEAAERRFQEE